MCLFPYHGLARHRRRQTPPRPWRGLVSAGTAPTVRSPVLTVRGIASPTVVMPLDEAVELTEWAEYAAQMHDAFGRPNR